MTEDEIIHEIARKLTHNLAIRIYTPSPRVCRIFDSLGVSRNDGIPSYDHRRECMNECLGHSIAANLRLSGVRTRNAAYPSYVILVMIFLQLWRPLFLTSYGRSITQYTASNEFLTT